MIAEHNVRTAKMPYCEPFIFVTHGADKMHRSAEGGCGGIRVGRRVGAGMLCIAFSSAASPVQGIADEDWHKIQQLVLEVETNELVRRIVALLEYARSFVRDRGSVTRPSRRRSKGFKTQVKRTEALQLGENAKSEVSCVYARRV